MKKNIDETVDDVLCDLGLNKQIIEEGHYLEADDLLRTFEDMENLLKYKFPWIAERLKEIIHDPKISKIRKEEICNKTLFSVYHYWFVTGMFAKLDDNEDSAIDPMALLLQDEDLAKTIPLFAYILELMTEAGLEPLSLEEFFQDFFTEPDTIH